MSPDLSQGSNAHDIRDAWVYIDNLLIGVFEMPATIPILNEGNHELTIIAGIKKNGISNDRVPYPFYDLFQKQIELIPGVVDSVDVTVQYRDNAQFIWMEDFEDGSISMEGSGSFTTIDSMQITTDPTEVFEYDGGKNEASGKVVLGTGFQIFENSTTQLFDLPRSGQEIYLEMNFKAETEFVVGIYPISGTAIIGTPIVNFFSTVNESGVAEWKKGYISLKEDVNNAQNNGLEFRVFINVQTNNDVGEKQVFFDNLKLIHF